MKQQSHRRLFYAFFAFFLCLLLPHCARCDCFLSQPALVQSDYSPLTRELTILEKDTNVVNFTLFVAVPMVNENATEWYNLTLTNTNTDVTLWRKVSFNASWVQSADYNLTATNCSTVMMYNGFFELEGDLMGEERVSFRVGKVKLTEYVLYVMRKEGVLDVIFRVFISLLLVCITFCMGTDLEILIIWNYFKRPIAPMVGFASQYLIMPLTAFALSQIMPIDKSAGFGLLTIGCCPGGGGSNMWTLLFGGDLNLSMTMTFLSSIAAFGMMPFWMFLLGRFFVDTSKISIPYGNIAMSLALVVFPVIAGMALRHFRPIIAKKIGRFARPFSFLFLAYVLTFGTYVNWSIYRVLFRRPLMIVAGAPLPLLGFTFGGLFAFILRQNRKQIIAISLETGIQNVGIAMIILLYSMPQPYGAIGAVLPLTVSLFTPLPLVAILVGVKIKNRCKRDSIVIDVSEEGTDYGGVEKYVPMEKVESRGINVHKSSPST